MVNKSYLFLTLIVIGILGRWVLVPSIAKIHDLNEAQKHEKIDNLNTYETCFSAQNCLPEDLLHPLNLTSQREKAVRLYLQNNQQIFLKNGKYITYFLNGVYLNLDLNSSVEMQLKNMREKDRKAFFDGLFYSPLASTNSFLNDNFTAFKKFCPSRIDCLKLEIKASPEAWEIKNKKLEELFLEVEKSGNLTALVPLLDIIPNHPLLRNFLEKNYLLIVGENNIDRISSHLARYNPGWHDRQYKKILESNKQVAIHYFIETLNVGCPGQKKEIFKILKDKYFLQNDSSLEAIKNSISEQASYLFSDNDSERKEFRVQDTKLKSNEAKDSKCTRSFGEI